MSGIGGPGRDHLQDLLDRHEYATYAEVHIKAEYFLERTVPSGRKTMESYKLMARATDKTRRTA